MTRPRSPKPVPSAVLGLLTILAFGLPSAPASGAGTSSPSVGTHADAPDEMTYTASDAVKINIMAGFAHPDDEVGFIAPCGVWHDLYGVRCGLLLFTRGEGGGNAVGPELYQALGLRRENEDRVSHYRSGTVDIFNTETIDFFYNQSAPLTEYFWNHDESICQITRVIRMTQPDIYIGNSPTLAVGHGNHQAAGRLIWEGALAAADPTMCPEQLTGPEALDTWQIKKVFSGGSTAGSGGSAAAPDCNSGFVPSGNETVYGVYTGYDSPYLWPVGNTGGGAPGQPKSWATIGSEGGMAHATQSRSMWLTHGPPGCSRYAMTLSYVPFQPNGAEVDGVEYAGKDDGILYGATLPDPGGLPVGTLEYLTFSRFYNVAGEPFDVTLQARSGSGTLEAGNVELGLPSGWTVDSATKPIGPISDSSEATATFTVTPPANAGTGLYKISANLASGEATGYTDNVVQIVPPIEGRFHRFGKFAEFDQWVTQRVPEAGRVGRSPAAASMAVGETIPLVVDVHNWSSVPQSGEVALTVPSGFAADATSKPYGPLAPGADTSVAFTLTNTNTALASSNTANNQTYTVGIATSYSSPAGSSSDSLTVSLVPQTTIPAVGTAPALDGAEAVGEYPGPALSLATSWQGIPGCVPAGINCGSLGAPGTPTSSYARVVRSGDDLYFFVHVRDDFQSYAVQPNECFAHWLVDSVEILIDPRGNSSQTNWDTATTFKLAVYPYTNDPENLIGTGPNGPCWARDADNHQGFSVGPLAETVPQGPNAPGVEVVSTASWVGDNQVSTPHAYGVTGDYNLEVKIPMSVLPAAVGPTDPPPTADPATNVADPLHMGLNITPYDVDAQSAAPGSGTLRRGDLVSMLTSTRTGWSNYGSVQSDPWRWGHAYLEGYTPPPSRPTTPPEPIVVDALKGVDSPQTIYQSAIDGVPIAGLPPGDAVKDAQADLGASSVKVDVQAREAARGHIFLWYGVDAAPEDHAPIPVWVTSCTKENDPPPDYGFTACSPTDGAPAPWAPDMQGRIVDDRIVSVEPGSNQFSIPISATEHDKLASLGSVLVSFEEPSRANQAFHLHFDTPGDLPAECQRLVEPDKANLIIGTDGADVLKGTPGPDVLCGRSGRDRIRGLGGDDVLIGGRGRDRMIGGSGDDALHAGRGKDVAKGGSGDDRIAGDQANDRLVGGAGDDFLNGMAGRDTCRGGAGRNRSVRCES